ncbi:hypothetical protein PHLGIDRAFT_440759 [Phlebiopsis gigantea 11061_1 CR5-6]|uniref:Uncharacterized protein n=1 Tax=Phlebiopsis gigantea (strain 11061_1 CR5-6) TaxID=745531 RepID=A0A0C3PVE0_PHLG1|nr:hypothetical protein PHLGIDRAFT_440759 [Phlebiopsis gigantea 11061_1 CR5-6]
MMFENTFSVSVIIHHIATVGAEITPRQAIGVLSVLNGSLPQILMNRFMLNLRSLDARQPHSYPSSMSIPNFPLPSEHDPGRGMHTSNFIGNIGEYLDFAERVVENESPGDVEQ